MKDIIQFFPWNLLWNRYMKKRWNGRCFFTIVSPAYLIFCDFFSASLFIYHSRIPVLFLISSWISQTALENLLFFSKVNFFCYSVFPSKGTLKILLNFLKSNLLNIFARRMELLNVFKIILSKTKFFLHK